MPHAASITRTFSSASFIALFGAFFAIQAQPPDRTNSQTSFEVVSVKVSQIQTGPDPRDGTVNPARVRFESISLMNLVTLAYKVPRYRVSGPDWLSGSRFDIDAKLPVGALESAVPAMIKDMLERYFSLRARREERTLPGYSLVVGKSGAHLAPSLPRPIGSPPPPMASRPFSMSRNAIVHHELKNTNTAGLASFLSKTFQCPVLDQTGLSGHYDIVLDYAFVDMPWMQNLRSDEAALGPSVLDAVDKLGLKLEAKKVPADIIVIEHVDRLPAQ
jgi:uncharacterized protein (TIGR03435 family)